MKEVLQRRPRYKRHVNWMRFVSVLALFLIITSAVVGASAYFYLKSFQADGGIFDFLKKKEHQKDVAVDNHKDQYVFLLMGTDANLSEGKISYEKTRSDTMIVAIVNTKAGTTNMISIPRDSRVYFPDKGKYDKITHAHAFGGPELSVACVENFLDIDIDYYLEINYDGFKEVIDIIGGVPIDVPKNMYYVDPTQDLVINLKKGQQVLNGENALGFVRFRHDALGDIGRVQRQEIFMKELFKKMLTPEGLLKIPEVAKKLPDYVLTNISPKDILYFGGKYAELKNGKINTYMVEGAPEYIDNISYWIPDDVKVQTVVQDMMAGTYAPPEELAEKEKPLKVEIQNGSGVPGMAALVADELLKKGYVISKKGNADNFNYQQSEIKMNGDFSKKITPIKELIGNPKVIKNNTSNASIDLVLIIGKDYANKNAVNEQKAGE